ncbi:MAG: hypothetical protein ACI9KS_000001 [Sulfitobacter sp.]|jgi:uncharacterized protein (TIGR02300 family)
MPKEEWGVKRLCPQTGKRFYDMNRSPIISPYTGEVVEIDTGRKSTVGVTSKAMKAKPAKVAEPAEETVIEDDDTDDVDLGDDVLEDDDDEDTVALDDLADVAAEDNDD